MDKNNIYQAVNEYLAEWDPIGLPQEIADVEYADYVQGVVDSLSDKEKLCSCLMTFLEKLGISQDNVNVNLKEEINKRAEELIKLRTTCLKQSFRIK